jgi:hypothetical protein
VVRAARAEIGKAADLAANVVKADPVEARAAIAVSGVTAATADSVPEIATGAKVLPRSISTS